MGAVPTLMIGSFTYGGDCEAIEHNMSWTEYSIRLQKYEFYSRKSHNDEGKCIIFILFLFYGEKIHFIWLITAYKVLKGPQLLGRAHLLSYEVVIC